MLHHVICVVTVVSGHRFVFIRRKIYNALSPVNTLRTGDADLCFYITTLQDG